MTKKSPMSAEQVLEFIAQMKAETKSAPARRRMAELAISHGNISAEGKQIWRDYLESGAGR